MGFMVGEAMVRGGVLMRRRVRLGHLLSVRYFSPSVPIGQPST